jgi:DnaJ-class molecular chaperone
MITLKKKRQVDLRKSWRGVVISSRAGGDIRQRFEGETLESALEHGFMFAIALVKDGPTFLTDLTCVCLNCMGTGAGHREIKGRMERVNCGPCGGKGNFETRKTIQVKLPEGFTLKRKNS